MHSCKVQSHPAAHVQPAEYEEQRKRVSLGLFPSALLKAQEQVMGKEHAWELRYYQREFSLPLSRNIFGLFTIPVYINHEMCIRDSHNRKHRTISQSSGSDSVFLHSDS